MANKNTKRPTYSKPKFIVAFCVTMALFAAIRHGFSLHIPMPHIEADTIKAQVLQDENTDELAYETTENISDSITAENAEDDTALVEEDTIMQEEKQEDSISIPAPPEPPTLQKKHRVLGVHSWTECFPDSQSLQIVAAEKNGIRPCSTREEAQKLIARHKLVNITNSPFYVVDDLRHSLPYLVPKAQHMLNTICLNFIDSLQVKGIPPHLPMITSVLRTTEDVSHLQRGNGNATTNSCHCYGTTVDITYNRFMPLTGRYTPDMELTRWSLPMKQVLAEVLRDLREQGVCYVKYERKQACFHLTVR